MFCVLENWMNALPPVSPGLCETAREIFHLLVHTPDAHPSLDWGMLKPGVGTSSQVFHMVAGTQLADPSWLPQGLH